MTHLAEWRVNPGVFWYRRVPGDTVDPEVRAAGIAGLRLACGELDMSTAPVLAWMRACSPPTRRTIEHLWSGKPLAGSCSGAREIRVNAALSPERSCETASHECHHAWAWEGGLGDRPHLDDALEAAAEHFGVLIAAKWAAGQRGPMLDVVEWRPSNRPLLND